MVRVSKSVTIKRPPKAVYDFWRQLENLPRFMHHLQEVRSTGNGRSHWIAKAPAGQQVEWDAEIVDERPDELIVWRALPGSDIQHEGSVHFRPAPGDRGTEVEVALQVRRPGWKSRSARRDAVRRGAERNRFETICGGSSRSWKPAKSCCRMAASKVPGRARSSSALRRRRQRRWDDEGDLLDGQAKRRGPRRP